MSARDTADRLSALRSSTARALAPAAALLIVCGLSGCGRAAGSAGPEPDRSEILRQAERFSRAFEQGDVDMLTGLYTEDAVLLPPGRPPQRGREEIRAFWSGRAPDFRVLEHSLEPHRLEIEGDVALDEGVWQNTTRWKEEPPRTSSGVYLVTWRRGQDGQWRMQFDMWHPPLPEPDAAGDDALVLMDVSVVPMSHDTVLAHQSVLVRHGRIAAVAPAAGFQVPPGARLVDAGGRYLVPGLIDSHVHLRAESELASYLQYGITSVVNMRGSASHTAARNAIRRGDMVGPRIFTAGPLIDGDPPIWSGGNTRVVTTAAAARDVVQEHVRAGYDLVKVYNNLDPALLRAVVEAAHRSGLAVVGHLPRRPVRSEGLDRGLEAGIDLIAHGEEVFFTRFGGAPDSLIRDGRYTPPTDAEIEAVAGAIREGGAAVTPNLSFIAMTARMLEDLEAVYSDPEFSRLDPQVQEMWREQNPVRRPDMVAFRARERAKYDVVRRLTLALHQAGVPLLAGTDASAPGMYPGASLHVELTELVSAGLSPFEALSTATRLPGKFLSRHIAEAPELGVIAPGYAADLLIVDANPLRDLSALARPWRVIRAGHEVQLETP